MFGYRSRRRSSAGRTRGRSVPTRRSTRNSQLSRFNRAAKTATKKFNTKTTPSKPRVATPSNSRKTFIAAMPKIRKAAAGKKRSRSSLLKQSTPISRIAAMQRAKKK